MFPPAPRSVGIIGGLAFGSFVVGVLLLGLLAAGCTPKHPQPEDPPTSWCQAYSRATPAERKAERAAGNLEDRRRMLLSGYIIDSRTEICWISFEQAGAEAAEKYCDHPPIDESGFSLAVELAGQEAERCYLEKIHLPK